MASNLDETAAIRASIALPLVVQRIEHSLETLKANRNILNRLYGSVGWNMLQQAKADLHEARRALSMQRIRVVQDGEVDGVPQFLATCRDGRQQRFGIARAAMQGEITEHIGIIGADIAKKLRNA